jgi:hypothetical protein
LRSRFRSERNAFIALVPFSDPRTRFSRFIFAADFFVALERARLADFANLFIQRSSESANVSLLQAQRDLLE